ncbi:unnamed protein product [Adineta ricciae]|uniref:Receptor for retinol uptake STRA6 n=1 Tax=Adineta ricciae TaxID=249248 RepID=A0A814SPB0_ADIRI|nr:unnamed protein product [Adineta ricciae]CAF1275800.1 unnamed protein product [Adineta ricciae]
MTLTVILSVLFPFLYLASTTGQNCSTYNPCGSYGYCGDDLNGNAVCTCKFWWTGTVCTEQSSSGIQVITLGVLVFFLIAVFYGLSIGCSIRRKRQQPKKEKPNLRINENTCANSNLKEIALTNVKESARCSSCFVAVLMVILTIIALTVKWLLIQPIHNELVKKYNVNDSLFYQREPICDIIDFSNFNMLTFPIACFLVLIFIISSKRTSCLRDKFKGYIGPVIPLDFYVHIKRKFAAVIFAIIADELLSIVMEVITGNSPSDQGVIIVYLLRILSVLVIGLRYYPILSAAYMDTILALICATFYAWLNFCVSVYHYSRCQSDFYPSNDNFGDTNGTDLMTLFSFYGTGQNLVIIQIFNDLPQYLCWSYILIKLPMLSVEKIYKWSQRKNGNRSRNLCLTREEKILLHSSVPHSVEMRYVRNLFRAKAQRSITRSFLARLIPKMAYQWRDDFRFSSRIFSVYATVFLLLIFLTIQACVLVVPHLSEMENTLQTLIDAITQFNDVNKTQRDFPIPKLFLPYLLAILTAFVVTTIQLLVLLASIRRNLFQIYRGDVSEIPQRDKSKYLSYTTGNFHFAGYFIGYVIWGYILTAAFAFILYICIDAFITYGSVRFLENILKKIIPILLLIVFKQYLNNILARYVFLQYYGDILAINNRRILMIFLYFNFFLDAFLGFVSSIVRIIKSVIGGCLYMSRLDYSPMGRKLETFDAGFAAYCGFIHIEAVHRNPVMLAFASYVYGRMKTEQYVFNSSVSSTVITGKREMKKYSSKASRKWYLAVLLIRNPSFVTLRKHSLRNGENEEIETLKPDGQRLSLAQNNYHRASLISEIDLQQIWQNNHVK